MIYLLKTTKMGNILPTQIPEKYFPEQPIEHGMTVIKDLDFNKKYSIGGHFLIERIPTKESGIYKFFIYHRSSEGILTEFHQFNTFHSLSHDNFNISYYGSIVQFTFSIASFDRDESTEFILSFYFFEPFDNNLTKMPLLLNSTLMITHLSGKFWCHIPPQQFDGFHELYLVEVSDDECRGLESSFREGDRIIMKFNIQSENIPSIRSDEEGNLFIDSDTKGIDPIKIEIPDGKLTLSQMLLE